MPIDPHRVQAVFLAAVQQTVGSRPLFLDRECGCDAGLRQRVETLLQAHDEPGSFLNSRPAAVVATIDMPAEPPIAVAPGTVIGPYKLLQQIGEGGMGTVYMAEQTQPVQRKVALKVIKVGMDSRQVIARFEAERQALAMMDHVNIARVLDAGATEAGRPYFVMELVHGVSIIKYCDDNHLTPRQRLELFVPVCQAIQHAHQKGIIHRDIKPSNVMITLYDGKPVPKVIDFGVAKAIESARGRLTERTLFTQYGTMVGTLEYTSPEQAEMSALGVDTRSDIFSLGVLLYELLTGSTPLSHKRVREAAYAEVLRMIRDEEPPRPSTRLSDSGEALASISSLRHMEPAKLTKLVRGELDWIVMKTLEKDRNRRYETAIGLARDVQRYLDDEPVLACPPSAMYRLRKLVRRNKGPVLAASLLLLALLGGIIGTTRGMIRATVAEAVAVNEAQQKEQALTEKEAALSTARQSERDAKEQLFLALLNEARTHRFSHQMGQRMNSLDVLAKAAAIHPDEQLRDEAIAAMALPDIRRGPSLLALPAGTQSFAFDGAYQSYARINEQGLVSVRSIPDNEEIRSINTKAKSVLNMELSRNGQFLTVIDGQYALQLWRVADGKPLLREELQQCLGVAFSPDNRQLAVGKDDWVVAIDMASGQESNRWRLPARSYALAFHPHDQRLAVGYSESPVASIYDAAQGSLIADLPVGLMNNQVVAWHPDGDRLAVAGSDPRIQIWDVAAKRRLATLEGHVQHVTALSFHPDGGLLASRSWDGVLRLWDPATGRQLMQSPLAAVVKFSSTGQCFGFVWQGGEELQLLEVTPSREYRSINSSLGGGQGHHHYGDISPDGRLLALGMGGAGDRLWDLASGRELAVLPTASECVLFQPNSRELLTFGAAGLDRWPIQESQDASNELRLGPPRTIALPVVPHRAARSPDGRTLAMVSEVAGAGLLMDLSTESFLGERFAHPMASEVALSQDGRWIVSSGWHSDRVRLWNAQTGKMVHEWVLGGQTGVFFTPDSRALVICRGVGFSFWDVDTLQLIRQLDRDVALYPGRVAFSPDGELMALEMAPAIIHLKEVATGRTVAKLEDPHGDRAGWMGFTPDGTQLVVAAPYANAIHIWDLRAIRERLTTMGLDWNWPEFPPAAAARQVAEHMKVEIRLSDDIAAKSLDERAWQLATNPDSALRDAKRAVELAQESIELVPKHAYYWNTLGVAQYRAGNWNEAIAALNKSMGFLPGDVEGLNTFFLAMAHWQLDNKDEARRWFNQAVAWMEKNEPMNEELRRFRAEAAELLGVKEK